MTALTWPTDVIPNTQSMYLQPVDVRVWNKPASGNEYVASTLVQRWRCRMTFELGRDLALKMDTLLTRLRGPVGTVLVPVFRELPQSVRGTPQLSLAAAGAYSLALTGCTPSLSVLPAGTLIQTSAGRLHRALEDVTANGSGAATVSIDPGLRVATQPGSLVTTDVKVEMRLTTKDAGKNETKRGMLTSYTLEFIEAW